MAKLPPEIRDTITQSHKHAVETHAKYAEQQNERATDEGKPAPYPPYELRLYPKMKHHATDYAKSVVVSSPDEEKLLGPEWGDVPAPKPVEATPADEMAALKERLAQLEAAAKPSKK